MNRRFVITLLRLARSKGLAAIGGGIFLAALGLAQTPVAPTARLQEVSPASQVANDSNSFPCDTTKAEVLTSVQSPSKHPVRLSWIASVSLSTPPDEGDGYNVYRINPTKPCTRLNDKPLRETTMEDSTVELGNEYSYAVTALKKNVESKTSIPVTVTIPPN